MKIIAKIRPWAYLNQKITEQTAYIQSRTIPSYREIPDIRNDDGFV